ncbi:MAG TPA: GNAT family N-acetyltransferase [Anaerolineae bacterium]|nr:GNAT family N-acetyltransferase [Anaerolineae bacterium]
MNPDEQVEQQAPEATASPLPEPSIVHLRDGTAVTIRPIVPEDAPLLQALFHRLSPESIFFRFLGRPKELPRQQAERLANLDYRRQMAFVATLGGDIIGVARYAQSSYHEEGLMEAAVVVEDEYQSRGLGTILLNHLSDYAREQGVLAFLASIHQTNDRILGFIRKSGLRTESRIEAGLWEIRVYLD